MARAFDVIVLGLGGMGSAAVYHLTGRGLKVLGIEQFTPAHDRGSSHGKTRVIRQSYYEDPAYVPLLLRSYELWRELEQACGESLLFEVGGLMIGTETSAVVSGSLRSARTYDLPHEVLSAAEITRRFPVLTPPSHHIALHEKRAGYVLPEKCVLAHLHLAAQRGAELHFEEKVLSWTTAPNGEGARITTTKGTYEAGQLIISPGPWAPQILAESGLPFAVERQVLYWLESSVGTEPFLPDRFPIFISEAETGVQTYGFPAVDGPAGGVKVAFHRAPNTRACTPESIERTVQAGEIQAMREAITPLIPALTGKCVHAVTCMYTNTPDQNFILARHPEHKQVVIGCGFSGHGFKFSSVIGEVLADLAVKGSTSFDIAFLRPERFIADSGAGK
jgi:sarcosine oxidase